MKTHCATFVAQLAVAEQTLALLYAWVSLSVVKVLQLIDVVLALGLALLHVNVCQDALNNADLHKYKCTAVISNSTCHEKIGSSRNVNTHSFFQVGTVWMFGGCVPLDLSQ